MAKCPNWLLCLSTLHFSCSALVHSYLSTENTIHCKWELMLPTLKDGVWQIKPAPAARRMPGDLSSTRSISWICSLHNLGGYGSFAQVYTEEAKPELA